MKKIKRQRSGFKQLSAYLYFCPQHVANTMGKRAGNERQPQEPISFSLRATVWAARASAASTTRPPNWKLSVRLKHSSEAETVSRVPFNRVTTRYQHNPRWDCWGGSMKNWMAQFKSNLQLCEFFFQCLKSVTLARSATFCIFLQSLSNLAPFFWLFFFFSIKGHSELPLIFFDFVIRFPLELSF